MKKIWLLFAMIVCSSTLSFAQLTGGIKGGLNLSNFGGDDADGSDIRPSVHLGGYLNKVISEKFSFQPELVYNAMGAKDEMEIPDIGNIKATLKLSYISVPFLFIYSPGAVNFQVGPQFGILVAAKAKLEVSGQSIEESVKSQFKDFDLGFNFGLGGNFGKFNVSARYYLGFANIVDEEEANLSNTNIQLSLGYRLYGE